MSSFSKGLILGVVIGVLVILWLIGLTGGLGEVQP